jgi:hypothetical protein
MAYTLLRNLHLGAGLFAAVFLFAYGLSAAQMAYPIYRLQPRETVTIIDVSDRIDTSPRALARWLMDRHGLRGSLTEVSDSGGVTALTIARTGTTHRVEFDEAARTAEVKTSTHNAVGMLNRIHHVRGLGHEYWATNAWGWFLLVVSASLLLLAGTGVVMWFTRHRERRVGGVVLAAGLTWGLTLLVLIRSA